MAVPTSRGRLRVRARRPGTGRADSSGGASSGIRGRIPAGRTWYRVPANPRVHNYPDHPNGPASTLGFIRNSGTLRGLRSLLEGSNGFALTCGNRGQLLVAVGAFDALCPVCCGAAYECDAALVDRVTNTPQNRSRPPSARERVLRVIWGLNDLPIHSWILVREWLVSENQPLGAPLPRRSAANPLDPSTGLLGPQAGFAGRSAPQVRRHRLPRTPRRGVRDQPAQAQPGGRDQIRQARRPLPTGCSPPTSGPANRSGTMNSGSVPTERWRYALPVSVLLGVMSAASSVLVTLAGH
ncbi:MAG: hypothetical protein JWN00_5928 [Actinomycetia bacterium]|nr:hypothetical protein [Actinomycetes bacterium]